MAALPRDTRERRRLGVARVLDWTKGRGLEIGPLAAPVVSKGEADVWYTDVRSAEDLRRHYAGDPAVDPDKIVEVDSVLLADGRLQPISVATAAAAPFDWVIAAHVIEHVPDLVTFLADVAEVLVDDGRLALIVPDRRYSFDRGRLGTTTGQILQAHHDRDQRPSLRAVYDHLSAAVTLSPHDAWAGRIPGPDHRVHDRVYVRDMVARYRDSLDYIDCHVWLFTPDEFVQQLAELAELGLLDFIVDDVQPTPFDDLEFQVTLRRLPRELAATERAALMLTGFPRLAQEGPPPGLPPGTTLRLLSHREARLLDAKRRVLGPVRATLARCLAWPGSGFRTRSSRNQRRR